MLEGHHYQNAYVTRDIGRWIETFKLRADIDRLITYEGATEVVTRSGPGVQSCKLAFIWIGDLQYELIEPISGAVDIYRDALPAGDGLVFHHICMRVPAWEPFRDRVDTQPYPIVLEGGNEALRFLYLDARQFLGHFLEYTWMTEERWLQLGAPSK
jgi:hypothetical protein